MDNNTTPEMQKLVAEIAGDKKEQGSSELFEDKTKSQSPTPVEDDDAGDDEEIMSLVNAMMSRKVEQSPTPVEDDDAGDDEEIMSLVNAMMSRKVEQPAESTKLVAEIAGDKKEQGSSELFEDKTKSQSPAPVEDDDAGDDEEIMSLVNAMMGSSRKVKTSPKTGAILYDDLSPSSDESDS